MASWLEVQQRQLAEGLRAVAGAEKLRVVQPFFRYDGDLPNVEVVWSDDKIFRKDPNFTCDIFFSQGYPLDYERLAFVRKSGRAKVLASWFWDNHHMMAESMHAAMLSDVIFCAHSYAAAYLTNEISRHGGFVPLCPVFWLQGEVTTVSEQVLLAPRSDLLYGGYNSYAAFPERDVILAQIMAALPEHRIFMTPHGTPTTEHPFYKLTSMEMLTEWMKYKVTLNVSFGKNTAMRIFDTLLAGGIPVVVGRPLDLDSIIPPPFQELLPVIVVDSTDADAVIAGYRLALERFDQGGLDGIMYRTAYLRQNHMPANRLGQMIDRIRQFGREPPPA